jgi:hypothetical protein
MASCGGRWLRVGLLGGTGLLTGVVGAHGLTVYDDALAPSWNALDYSWDSTVNPASGAPVHGGAAAIAVTPSAAWGALSLRTSSPLAGSSYTSIRFWVYGAGAGGTQLDVTTQPTDGGTASAAYTLTAPSGVWTQFVVPLSALGNPAAIARINFQDHTGTVQPTYSVDDVDVVPTGGGGGVYVAENRSIVSSGVTRNFVLSHRSPLPAGALPLVFSLHGDSGTGAGMRVALPLEGQSGNPGAVFVYPDGPNIDGGGFIFEYYTYDGRSKEAIFVQDVIALLSAELGIDTQRVYVVGMSGGATMANALGCRLGPGVIRGLGIHSGTLYPVNDGGGQPALAGRAVHRVRHLWPAAVVVCDPRPAARHLVGGGAGDVGLHRSDRLADPGLVLRRLRERQPRRLGPLVALNCGRRLGRCGSGPVLPIRERSAARPPRSS